MCIPQLDIATLKTRLEEARTAYHNLNTGKMPRVVVDQNGERVEFTAANRTGLYNYIQQLESQLAALMGCPGRTTRPAGFIF